MAVRGKVLIVEDDRAICSFMRRVLEANGYESIIVGTGREALSMLTSHCPDVVILDLGLPDMDGMDVLTQLRAWSLMPVVVVSARTDEREKVRALDANGTAGAWSSVVSVTYRKPAAATVASGKCGDSASWKLDAEGTLTISGTGRMYDYEWPADRGGTTPPWLANKYRDSIRALHVEQGITYILSLIHI